MPTAQQVLALPRTSPEQQGVASSAILAFIQALESQKLEMHSFMLLRHGAVIAEGWWSPYRREPPHLMFSISKSFTSTAVGLAINEGHFSLDDPVLSFFPENAPSEISEHLAALHVRHLLSMSTGQTMDTWANMAGRPDGNWLKGFFEVPLHHAPGTYFLYNTGATYILSAIVQKTTGMKVLDYLQPRLFAPLGIAGATWQDSPQGITAGGTGLSLKTEDVARFGQLYLQKGLWQGQQIVPEAWVTEATRLQMANDNGMQTDWIQGYGYQFWRSRHGGYRGDGVFGQYCIVMPAQDAVLAMTGGVDIFGMQQPLNPVWELLLPAIQPDALPEDAAYDALIQKISSLALPTVQGQFTSPTAAQVSGRTYRADANALKLEAITLNFTETGCIITVKMPTGEETLPCGYDEWQTGKTALFHQPDLFEPPPSLVAVSGAWTAIDTFTLIVRLVQTPFYHTVACIFDGDELMIESQINLSMESMKSLLLTARQG